MSATLTTNRTAKLTQDDLARLTDAALEVILGHGVLSPSLDVELGLWEVLNKAYRREHRLAKWLWLTGTRTPSRSEILSALATAAFDVAIDSGADADEMLEIELDLLFAFQLVEINKETLDVLTAA